MKLNLGILVLMLTVVAAFSSCDRKLDPTPDYLDHVYPIQDGKYRIYHVIDTSYQTASGPYEARTYYRKEVTDGLETDLLSRIVSKLWLYESPDTINGGSDYEWTFSELWTQYLGDTYAERIEGNRRILVLRIPPYEGSTWNGNLYNNLDAQTYAYINLDSTVQVNGMTFEHCVVVEQVPFREAGGATLPFHSIEYAYEVYAPYVGKIIRFEKYYEAQNGTPVSDSHIYHEVLVEHNY